MQAQFLKYVSPEHLTYQLSGGQGFAEDKYLLGAFHMYEPWKYTMPKGKLVTLDDVPDWKEQVLGNLDLAAQWAKRWNKHVVMTEWASQSVPKVRTDFLVYTRFVAEEARKREIAWMYYCGEPRGYLAYLGPASYWSILGNETGWDQDVLDILTGTTAPPAPTFNLIRNSEFVPGFAASGGWGLSGWETSRGSAVSQVQNASLSGRNALRITLDGDDVAVFQDGTTTRIGKPETDQEPQTPGIQLRRGSTYRLTFMARAERDGTKVTVRLENTTENHTAGLASKQFSLAAESWEYAWEYNHAGDDVQNVRLKLLFSGTKNTVYLDRVMLRGRQAGP